MQIYVGNRLEQGICPHNPPIIRVAALRPYSKGRVKKNRFQWASSGLSGSRFK